MKAFVGILLAIGFGFSGMSSAQYDEPQRSRDKTSWTYPGNAVHQGWAGYLGLNSGYSAQTSDLNVEGIPVSAKLLGSYVTQDLMAVFDGGLGWQYQSFTDSDAQDDSISGTVLELAARYQFESRWQLGAVYNQFFDKGENFGSNQSDAEFAGIQLMKEFGFAENYLGRASGRIMTSINVNGESVNMAMVDFQMGWGGWR